LPEAAGTGALTRTFTALRSSGRRAFIPYITAGDPEPARTVEVMQRLADAGADVIELGIPFSDPLADGPTIQAASWRALQRGVDIEHVLRWTREFRDSRDTPVVLFTYVNPVLRFGSERFLERAGAAGAAGLLITDLPVGEDESLETVLSAGDLDLVRLVAPTTPPARLTAVLAGARGFVYYISRTGVTGERVDTRAELAAEIEGLRRHTSLPIAVGFGISTPEQAATVAAVADGVIMGSALVRTLEEEGLEAAADLARRVRAAIDGIRE
jgi:tryptophan synthase alpha chain